MPLELRGGLVTVAQAEASGVSRAQLNGPSWLRVTRGHYRWVGADADRDEELSAALECLPPGSAFAGETAAWLHGIVSERPGELDVVMPVGSPNRHASGMRFRRVRLDPGDFAVVRGLPVASVEATLWLICVRGDTFAAVPYIDRAVHLGLTTVPALEQWFWARGWQRPGSRWFGDALELADGAAESFMESRLRMLLVASGLPSPEVQVELFDPAGHFVARADMYYRRAGLAIEYDGSTHKSSIVEDNRRYNRLVQAGYRALRFTYPDVAATPHLTALQVAAQLGITRLVPNVALRRPRKRRLLPNAG